MTLLILFASLLTTPSSEPTEVELAVIASREGIKSGRISLKYRHVGALGRMVTTGMELEFDGTKRFMKVVDEGGPELYPPSFMRKTTRHVLTATEYMTHSQENEPTGTRIAAFVDDLRAIEAYMGGPDGGAQVVNIEHRTPFDPRILGCIPDSLGTTWLAELDSYLGAPRVNAVSSMLSKYQGKEVTYVDFLSPLGSEVEMWIDTERDYSPVKMQVLFPLEADQTRIVDMMEAELAQFANGTDQRWFPNRIVQKRILRSGDADRTLETEEIEVISADFNIPIPEDRFTLSALELPEDTLIVHRPESNRAQGSKLLASQEKVSPVVAPSITKWDGQAEAKLTPADIEARQRKFPLPQGRSPTAAKMLLWINLIILGGTLFYFGIKRLYRFCH